ncbi:hypothetical protein PG987_010069 [Apiospora arundinis]
MPSYSDLSLRKDRLKRFLQAQDAVVGFRRAGEGKYDREQALARIDESFAHYGVSATTNEKAISKPLPSPAVGTTQISSMTTHGKDGDEVAVDATNQLVYNAIRELVRKDSAFSEDVVNGVKHLVGSGRGLLYLESYDIRKETTGNSTCTDNTQTTPPSQPTNAPNDASSSQGSGSHKKRSSQPDTAGDADSLRPRVKRRHEREPDQNLPTWPCPYCLAYVLLPYYTKKFWACRLPSGHAERDDFKKHLLSHHRHNPKAEEIPQAYFMNQWQWDDVVRVLEKASKTRFQKGSDSWLKAQITCYHDIWRILFPPDSFPALKEPPSNPFQMTRPDHREPLEQVNIMYSALQYVDASRAVEADEIEFVQDYRPTFASVERNMEDAFAVVTKILRKYSPGNAEFLETIASAYVTASMQEYIAGRDPSLALRQQEQLQEEPQEEPQEKEYSMSCSVSKIDLVIPILHNLQPNQTVHIKVPSLDSATAIGLLRSLGFNHEVRTDQNIHIEVMSAGNSTQIVQPTPTINCSGNHGDSAALPRPFAQMYPCKCRPRIQGRLPPLSPKEKG